MSEKALVIIPTYNEIGNLPQIVPQVLSQDPRIEILVVDDGSPDGTGQLADKMAAENPRVHAIHRSGKLGLGTAYVAGFKWALERDYEYVFEMDADFSHDPKYLPALMAALANADLAIGSRYVNGRVNVVNWPVARLLLSYFANIYARIVTGVAVADLTAGFKCYRRKVLAAINLGAIRSNGYAFQIEMHCRAAAKGFKIVEIPIVFVDRTEGHSKMSGAIVREAVWMVWRLRLQSMFGRL